ncbi:MAG TPA: hypothetical protein ENJ38_11310 [Rhodospirillales bacterium]|nr:hypothetical protein [Rhodospirillales bacterium]
MTAANVCRLASELADRAERILPDEIDMAVRITGRAWVKCAGAASEDRTPTCDIEIIMHSRANPEVGAVVRRITDLSHYEVMVRGLRHLLQRKIERRAA